VAFSPAAPRRKKVNNTEKWTPVVKGAVGPKSMQVRSSINCEHSLTKNAVFLFQKTRLYEL
jgi:hypothetical protein